MWTILYPLVFITSYIFLIIKVLCWWSKHYYWNSWKIQKKLYEKRILDENTVLTYKLSILKITYFISIRVRLKCIKMIQQRIDNSSQHFQLIREYIAPQNFLLIFSTAIAGLEIHGGGNANERGGNAYQDGGDQKAFASNFFNQNQFDDFSASKATLMFCFVFISLMFPLHSVCCFRNPVLKTLSCPVSTQILQIVLSTVFVNHVPNMLVLKPYDKMSIKTLHFNHGIKCWF